MSTAGPLAAKVEMSGPYKQGKQEAWAYRDGRKLTSYANVIVGGEMYTIVVTVPRGADATD